MRGAARHKCYIHLNNYYYCFKRGEIFIMEYGILCVLPVITILVIAVTTKRTLFAMTCGLSMAALILGKGPKGFAGSFFDNIYAAFSNDSLQWLLIVIALFGILIMLYERTGAVTDFGY